MAKFRITFNSAKCKGCELCRHICPKQVIVMSKHFNEKGYCPAEVGNQDACIGCQSCALICPDCCIEIFREEDDK